MKIILPMVMFFFSLQNLLRVPCGDKIAFSQHASDEFIQWLANTSTFLVLAPR